MTLNISNYALEITAATVSGAMGVFITWLVRAVLTDSKRLALLEQRQEMQHGEMVAAIKAIQGQVSKFQEANAMTVAAQIRVVETLDRLDHKQRESDAAPKEKGVSA